jgi:hypothetical protein
VKNNFSPLTSPLHAMIACGFTNRDAKDALLLNIQGGKKPERFKRKNIIRGWVHSRTHVRTYDNDGDGSKKIRELELIPGFIAENSDT